MATLKELQIQLDNETIREESSANVELKSSWEQASGKRISGIANELKAGQTGFLVIGVSDQGELINSRPEWLKETETKVTNHVREYLLPTQAVSIQGHKSPSGKLSLIVVIQNPGDIATWNNKAYKRVGTQTQEMSPNERLVLAMSLPGLDYSKQNWQGSVNVSLVEQFATKIARMNPEILPENLATLSPEDILERLHCSNKMAARILFGDLPVRVAYYDNEGDVVEQSRKNGTFSLLSDDFVSEVNRWTKGKGTKLGAQSISLSAEEPYPLKALRESIANAVCHALYERNDGEIIVDLHTDRFCIRNNCVREVSSFAKEWFSKKSWARNKFLMQLLREAGFTDELGSGKTRLFSQMLEAGRKEPLIEYYERDSYACWQVTLYNEQSSTHAVQVLARLKELLGSVEDARLAMALVLWRDQTWPEIMAKLDKHYQNVAHRIVRSSHSPIAVIGSNILTKRWVSCALSGQLTISFTPREEQLFKDYFHTFAFKGGRNGILQTTEAKRLIGLSNTPSESTQLSNLFRKWNQEDIVERLGRGKWRFKSAPANNVEAIGEELESSTAEHASDFDNSEGNEE